MRAIEADVFRATGLNFDPAAPSANGGRWGIPENGGRGTSVLNTSYEWDGALAEVASYLALLTPLPRSKWLKVASLAVTCARAVTLARTDLGALGVDLAQYGNRDYTRTQQIGAALQYLGADALIAPSARHACDNLMIFAENHQLDQRIEVVKEEKVDWHAWAREKGLLSGLE